MNTPRMRTTALPGAPFQLNGVEIPVEQWNVDHGGYLGSEAPVRVQLTFFARFEPEPETDEQRAERLKAEQEAAVAEAIDHWTMYRERYYAGQPLLLAVLDIHRPIQGYQRVDCAHCEQSDGMESTENAPWPCATFAALTAAPDAECRPADTPRPPKHGDLVHFRAAERRDCLPSFVHRVEPNGSLVVWPSLDAGPYPREATYDASGQADFSWHWPCGSDAPCTWKPTPGTPLNDCCPDCQHAVLVHIGVDHCPVCQLVAAAARNAN